MRRWMAKTSSRCRGLGVLSTLCISCSLLFCDAFEVLGQGLLAHRPAKQLGARTPFFLGKPARNDRLREMEQATLNRGQTTCACFFHADACLRTGRRTSKRIQLSSACSTV